MGQHQDIDYLVMEYLEGETLAARLAARGALPIDEVFAVATQITDALDAAHRVGSSRLDQVLPALLARELERLRGLEQEARAASALNHPTSSPSMTSVTIDGCSSPPSSLRARRCALDTGMVALAKFAKRVMLAQGGPDECLPGISV